MIIASRRRALPLAAAAGAACLGSIAALHYHRLGLTLSHYDARGHLIVARRIFDSLTPGWQQIGAVWLPLPHLLNALPVQIDAFYRSGASAVVLSVAAFALATGALARLVLRITDSAWAAAAAAVVFALNPNVLYLQATPMTEPLLIALTTLAVAMLLDREHSSLAPGPHPQRVPTLMPRFSFSGFSPGTPSRVGLAFALACLTRYEAWPVTVSALAMAAWARWRCGDPWRIALARIGAVAAYPAGAIVGFLAFSRVVIGQWFAGGFFVPENTALGHPVEALAQVGWGVQALSSRTLVLAGVAGLIVVVLRAWRPERSFGLVALSLTTAAALPWIAFLQGHPFRIRYMVPLLAAQAVGVGAAANAIPRMGPLLAAALMAVSAFELRPFDRSAPMVVEAQWDRPNVAVRRIVGDCLRTGYRGETVMASMGSLGHYMQELSADGFAIGDFLHEGNGDIWLAALVHPRPYAGWILIEEKAEGGDMLAQRARDQPDFLAGFSRVCEGAGVALYRRQ